jgi:hypothetical protein
MELISITNIKENTNDKQFAVYEWATYFTAHPFGATEQMQLGNANWHLRHTK